MSKVRIHALAKELGIESKRMLEMLHGMGVDAKTASSTIEDDTAEIVKGLVAEELKGGSSVAVETLVEVVPEKPAKAAKKEPVSSSTETTPEPVTEVVAPKAVKSEPVKSEPVKPAKEIPHRPPVVTIMGHVDHGKTSLLDYIRSSNVASKEAGGITQHVGAFEANTPRGKIVFIDTPGHEAFTSIRARGAQVADIAVIVVAADDSIMPQTREAIAHAKAAKVPIVVAINKIDIAGVNPDKVMQDLTNATLIPEAYGGDTIVVQISARTGQGVDDLLENLSLVAELEDLRADPDGELKGVIIEAKVDKQAGVLATVLVQGGTLEVSDFLVVGELYGKVRAMTDSFGNRITSAKPGVAVQVLGFSQTPIAGELVARARNEHHAREIIAGRKETRVDAADESEREAAIGQGKGAAAGLSIEDLLGKVGEVKIEKRQVNLILRADTQGSLEALEGILLRENNDDVEVHIMFAGIGAPTEGDVLLASTAVDTKIMGFSVTPSGGVQKIADNKKVEIKTYRIIYEMIDEVKKMIRGTIEPVFEDKFVGRAEVRQIIKVPKAGGNIAGSYVLEGKIMRSGKARVLRKGKEVAKGQISGLKRFKDDVREVLTGFECGINVSNFDEFEIGDLIEVTETVEVKD
jgi:translation initiation factor IF-2